MRRRAAATIGLTSGSSGVGTSPSCAEARASSEGFASGVASAHSGAHINSCSSSRAASRARRCCISRKRSLSSLRHAGRFRFTPGNSIKVEPAAPCVVLVVAFELSVIAGALACVTVGGAGRSEWCLVFAASGFRQKGHAPSSTSKTSPHSAHRIVKIEAPLKPKTFVRLTKGRCA